MRNSQWCAWLALLVVACAVPNVDIVDSLDDSGSNDDGNAGNGNGNGNAGDGGKQGGGKGGSGSTADAGDGSGNVGTDGGAGQASSGGQTGSGASGSNTGGSGTTPPPTGAAAKFCNEVTYNGEYIDVELRVGTEDDYVSIVATTGTCQPMVNDDCTAIPTGDAVPVTLYDVNGSPLTDPGTVKISDGEGWIFYFYYDETQQAAVLDGGTHGTPDQCSDVDFDDVFPTP